MPRPIFSVQSRGSQPRRVSPGRPHRFYTIPTESVTDSQLRIELGLEPCFSIVAQVPKEYHCSQLFWGYERGASAKQQHKTSSTANRKQRQYQLSRRRLARGPRTTVGAARPLRRFSSRPRPATREEPNLCCQFRQICSDHCFDGKLSNSRWLITIARTRRDEPSLTSRSIPGLTPSLTQRPQLDRG